MQIWNPIPHSSPRVSLVLLGALFGLFFVSEAFAWNPQVLNGRCQQTSRRCYSTVGNAGGQGSCCDPQSSSIGACEKNNRCSGGRPYKWPPNNIPLSWYFNPNGQAGIGGYGGIQQSVLEAALKKAWDAWSTPTCTSFRHKYQGTTTQKPTTRAPLVMYLASQAEWAQLGAHSSTLAFTRPIPRNDGTLVDGDIYFNPRPGGSSWGIFPNVGRREVDFTDVAAHEIGHALGFAHTSTRGLMYYSILCFGGNCFKGLYRDDQDAVCFTYKRTGPCSTDKDCGGCQKCSGGKCVPKNIQPARNLCGPCKSPADCGGAKDICIRLEEGNRCSMACDTSDCCPNGYRCSEISLGTKVCVPELGQCPAVRCSSDAQCGPGEGCQSGSCKPKPVPKAPKACKTCSSNADCGTGNKCLQGQGASRCAQPCVADNFCPTGFVCQSTAAGRMCMPENGICPCSSNADCDGGQVCQGGTCNKPGGGTFGDTCNEQTKCADRFQCVQTGNGGICIQACGAASSPAGSPGSPCRSNGSCDLGAQCFRLQNGGTICMPEACPSGTCRNGGQCYRVGQPVGNRCLCQNNAQCGSNRVCNTSLLRQLFGQAVGACANKAAPPKCETGFECRDARQGGACNPSQPESCFCLPGKTQKIGEPCGQRQCINGLICIRTNPNTQDAICVEDCTSSNSCKFGGNCNPTGGQTKVCVCNRDIQCGSGKRCKLAGQFGTCEAGGTNPPKKCGNGACDAGENCSTCAQDCKCPSGQTCQSGQCKTNTTPGSCGNNACEGAKGENCTTCPKDCGCPSGKTCQNGICKVPSPCGNNACEGAKGENCTTCPADCACGSGKLCQNGTCKEGSSCGNNACEGLKGENCTTCPADCACGSGKECNNGQCQVPGGNNGTSNGNNNNNNGSTDPKYDPNCDPDEQFEDEDGNWSCPEEPGAGGGCGCSTQNDPSSGFPFLISILFGLFLIRRRRR